ncbi:MAG: hypothetical protein NZ959_10255 [Armatimonadetes bacterium]|nr:hypothetical protein [Armatimonadota bacterium]MDW8123041.1 hypothetical protein [Armatimonadota bacterium]
MRVRSVCLLLIPVVGLALTNPKAPKLVLQVCPFDPALSLGVGFQGPHRHFDTFQVKEKTMNARISWFRAIEQPNPDAFDDRVYQEPPEQDWVWWDTLYPTTLIVEVRDKRKRLKKAEIWEYDRKLLEEELLATKGGSQIVGTVTLNDPVNFRQIVIKGTKEQVLANLLIQDLKVRLWIVTLRGGWIPHPPPRDIDTEVAGYGLHQGGHTVVTDVNWQRAQDGRLVLLQTTSTHMCFVTSYRVTGGCAPHTGEINDRHDVTSVGIIGPPPKGCSLLDTRLKSTCGTWVEVTPYPLTFDIPYCMTKRFRNDTPDEARISPPLEYLNKHVPVKLLRFLREWPLVTKEEPSQASLVEELDRLQDESTANPLTGFIPVRPYSEGCVHWDLHPTQPMVVGVWGVPYRKLKKTPLWSANLITSLVKPLTDAIMGRRINRRELLVVAAIEAFGKSLLVAEGREKEIWKTEDAKPIGDIWVLNLALREQGPMPGVRNITQDVRVSIKVGQTPMAGTVQITRGASFTNPSPPMTPFPPDTVSVPQEGATIALGKGWKWILTATAAGRQATREINVPPTTSVTIEIPPPQPPPGSG